MAAIVVFASTCVAAVQERGFVADGAELVVFEVASQREVGRIGLLAPARDFAISDDGSTAFVVDSQYLTTVDLQTSLLRKAVSVRAFRSGGDRIVLAPEGDRLFIASRYHWDGEPTVHVVDATTLEVLDEIPLAIPADGAEHVVIAFAPSVDRRRIFAVVVVDPGGREDLPPYICEVDLQSGVVTTRALLAESGDELLPIGENDFHGGTRSAVATEKGVIYLQADGPIIAVDIPTGRVQRRIDAPWLAQIVVDPAELHIYGWSYAGAGGAPSKTVYAIDPIEGTVRELQRIQGEIRASGMLPDGSTLLVAGDAAAEPRHGEATGSGVVVLPLRETGIAAGTIAFGPLPPPQELPIPTPASPPAPTPVAGGPYRGFAINSAASLLVEFDTDTGAISRRRTGVHLGGVRAAITAPDPRSLYLVRDSDVAVVEMETLEVGDVVALEESGLVGEYFAAASDSAAVPFGRTTPSARRHGGDVLYVSGAARGVWYELDVVDVSSRSRIRSVRLPGSARDIAVSADGSRVYVATGDAVVVVDAVELEQVAVVPARRRAQTLAVSADGRFAYVAGGSSTASIETTPLPPTLWVLDARSLRPLTTTVPLADRGEALQIGITPDSRRAIVAIEKGGAVVVDLDKLHVVATISLGRASLAVAIDAGAWQPPPMPTPRTLPEPSAPHACVIAVSDVGPLARQGAQLALIDPIHHQVVSTMDLGAAVAAVGTGISADSELLSAAADPIGGQLFATFSNGSQLPSYLVGIDLLTGTVFQQMALGITARGLAVARAEPIVLAYGRYEFDSTLSVIDMQRSQELADLRVDFPDGPILIAADGKRAYVRREWTDLRSYDVRVRNVAVMAIDIANPRILFDRPLPAQAGQIAVMADNSLWVDIAEDTIEVLDGVTGESVAEVAIPVSSWVHYSRANRGLAVSADGRFAYRVSGDAPGLVTVLDVAQRAFVAQIPVDLSLRAPVVSPDGRTLYAISAPDTLSVINLADGSVAGEIRTGGNVRALLAATTNTPCRTAPENAAAGPDRAPRPAQWSRIEVESTSADPGTTVAVAVRLATAGIEIVGVEVELRMAAPLRLAVDETGLPMCRVSTGHRKSMPVIALPRGCGARSDCTGLRALVFSLDNVEPIPDGSVLFTCDVHVAADAPAGIYRLRVLQVGASDVETNEVPMLGFGGAIAVPDGASRTPAGSAGGLLPAPEGADDRTDTEPTAAAAALATATPTATFNPRDTPLPGLEDGDADSRAAGLAGADGGSGCQVSAATSPPTPELWAVALAFLCLSGPAGVLRREFAMRLQRS